MIYHLSEMNFNTIDCPARVNVIFVFTKFVGVTIILLVADFETIVNN
jgi:hypothetical protein